MRFFFLLPTLKNTLQTHNIKKKDQKKRLYMKE
jgi:hypothetical protein